MDTCVWRLCDDEDELPLASAPERAAGWALEVAASLQLPESAGGLGATLARAAVGAESGGSPPLTAACASVWFAGKLQDFVGRARLPAPRAYPQRHRRRSQGVPSDPSEVARPHRRRHRGPLLQPPKQVPVL
eukprot:TRINITY_DN20177_c0_g1_i3.p2 TRINITY_DN20177_c0_g1~~TRINITY_DN20177_c0_g1_i3.p2  ORF type:complete len:132 (+),score=3.67 TRINITY_DN20177_c0_g1_i3:44-439(+)